VRSCLKKRRACKEEFKQKQFKGDIYLMSQSKLGLKAKGIGTFEEDPTWVSVVTIQNRDEVLGFITPSTYGASNVPLAQLTKRSAYLKEVIEDLPATQQEVNARLVGDKYVSPATLPLNVFLVGTFMDYAQPSSTLVGTGWYPCDGSLYALASPQGQVIRNLPSVTKTAYNLEVVGSKIRIFDQITTPAHNEGGRIRRPAGDGEQGTLLDDQLQAHQHVLPTYDLATVTYKVGTPYEKLGRFRTEFATEKYYPDPDFPLAGEPRVGNETRMVSVGVLPIVFLGV